MNFWQEILIAVALELDILNSASNSDIVLQLVFSDMLLTNRGTEEKLVPVLFTYLKQKKEKQLDTVIIVHIIDMYYEIEY